MALELIYYKRNKKSYKKILENKNIATNISRIQANDSIMWI